MSKIEYRVCDVCGRKLGLDGYQKMVFINNVVDGRGHVDEEWDLCDVCAIIVKDKILSLKEKNIDNAKRARGIE